MKKLLIISGVLIEPGQVREIHLPISETPNARSTILPITVVRGVEEGPCIFLTAAVHGDELNGIAILKSLMIKIKPEKLRGALIIVPIVNMLGFLGESRYLSDRRDLNRMFPGTPTGNMAQRIAYKFFHEVIRHADAGIDFHTGAENRENFPHVRGDLKNIQVRKYAKAFGCRIIIDQKGLKGTLRYAATERKIPTIVFEGGTANTFQRPIVQTGVRGTIRFLRNLGMLREKRRFSRKRSLPFQIVAKKALWVRADRGGLLELKVHPGELLYRGDPVAIISNPLGRDVHGISAPMTGLVIGVTTSPLVSPGMPIVHMVEINRTLKTIEKHLKNRKLTLAFPNHIG
ncbi:MAG: succinylglutamate desuccinylase/aspartoacylase family protein [Bdellovibrionales bacterium]|nr:succinylglutamate desuccinylase/aspartoacylase family protein [Bdellovibrionales bacterium]